MTGTTSNPPLLGDQPKTNIEHDEFGLAKLVTAISELLAKRTLPPGYIVGFGIGEAESEQLRSLLNGKLQLNSKVRALFTFVLGNSEESQTTLHT